MSKDDLPTSDSDAWEASLQPAIAALRDGGVVALPTDTITGLVALPTPAGVAALRRVKGRPQAQPFAMFVADSTMAATLATQIDPPVKRALGRFWPGALTAVLTRSREVQHLDIGGSADSIGLRAPDSRFLRALIAELGPLVNSSANRTGEEAVTDAFELRVAGVSHRVAGRSRGGAASTVVDFRTSPPALLRPGAIDIDSVLAAIRVP